MAARRNAAIEHDVAVEDAAHLVGDRFVHVAAFDEHGVDAGDRAALALAAALEQPRQQREHARWIAATCGRLSGGESDFALRTGHARHRIHEQQRVLAVVPKRLRDRGRHLGRAQAFERGRVAGRHDHDRAPPSLGAERALEKFADLAPPFADQCHHDHVGVRAARDRAEQRALADPRSGE